MTKPLTLAQLSSYVARRLWRCVRCRRWVPECDIRGVYHLDHKLNGEK